MSFFLMLRLGQHIPGGILNNISSRNPKGRRGGGIWTEAGEAGPWVFFRAGYNSTTCWCFEGYERVYLEVNVAEGRNNIIYSNHIYIYDDNFVVIDIAWLYKISYNQLIWYKYSHDLHACHQIRYFG